MPMSISELRRRLSAIEPDESMYRGIGPEEVPMLVDLLDDEEAWMAARAAHSLSRIDDDRARDAVRAAAGSARPEVREAVAASAARLPPEVSDAVLPDLLSDADVAVRKLAVRSTSERNSDAVRARLAEIADDDDDDALRRIADSQRKAPPG